MKKLALTTALICSLSLVVSPSSHAAFGLSACEKVKKQVLSLEKKELVETRKVSSIVGQYAWKFTDQENSINYSKMKKFDAFEYQLFKYMYNNQKCFTLSQKDFINQGYNYAKSLNDDFYYNATWDISRTSIYKYTYSGNLVSIYDE
jgi:hypothetical protein